MADEETISFENVPSPSENIESSKRTVFAPSLFDQIDKLSPSFDLVKEGEKKKDDTPEYEPEDLKGFVEFPFDISSMLTKYQGFELTEDESNRLTKLFVKPFARTFGKIENMDWLLFGMAMVSISTEKILFYKAHIAELKLAAKNAINTSGGK